MTQRRFPTLDRSELAELEPHGTHRVVRAGEYLYRAGDSGYDFYVVLSGLIEIVLDVDGEERVIVTHGAGRFLGELNLLTGLRVFVSARVAEDAELLAIPVEEFRRIIATQPQLSDKILATFMTRRNELMSDAGPRHACHRISLLARGAATARVPSRVHGSLTSGWIPTATRTSRRWWSSSVSRLSDYPVVVVSGKVFRRATPGVLAEYLGLTVERLPGRCFDLVIVGGGPSGLAAAVYGASEGLRTLGVDMVAPGGQAGTSSRIENYFGFPTGISGADLAQRGFIQAEKFGAQLTTPCRAVGMQRASGPSRRRAF